MDDRNTKVMRASAAAYTLESIPDIISCRSARATVHPSSINPKTHLHLAHYQDRNIQEPVVQKFDEGLDFGSVVGTNFCSGRRWVVRGCVNWAVGFSGPSCCRFEFEIVSPSSWVGGGYSPVIWAAPIGVALSVVFTFYGGSFPVRRGGTCCFK